MYIWPAQLPAQSNREDFLRTLSLFDDDTGLAIDVSGRTLAAPGDFTGANWTIVDGAIVGHSVTALTIKDYPIGSQMQAVSLVMDLGLAILATDFVTISDPTGLNTMFGYVTSYAPATGALVVQVGSAFEFEIRGHHHNDGFWSDYGPSTSIGSDDRSIPLISAQLGAGITLVDLGVMQVRIPAATINKLHHRTYNVAMTMFDGSDTRQIFVGKLPIISGGVRAMPLPISAASNPFGLP